jgi:hypothetical protein
MYHVSRRTPFLGNRGMVAVSLLITFFLFDHYRQRKWTGKSNQNDLE